MPSLAEGPQNATGEGRRRRRGQRRRAGVNDGAEHCLDERGFLVEEQSCPSSCCTADDACAGDYGPCEEGGLPLSLVILLGVVSFCICCIMVAPACLYIL